MAAQAQQQLDAGRTAEAQKLIGEAVRQRDDIAAVYLTQAHIAAATGNRGAAYQSYANAMSLEATNTEALLGVAQFGLSTGHMREAEAAADKILSLNPQQTDAMLVKGIAALVRNNREGAVGFADQILAVAPNDVGAMILKSRALALDGRKEQALALMQAGVKRTGYTPEMTMSLVELYRANGDPAPYLDALWRLKSLAPSRLDYRFDLVEALYRVGRRNEARAELVLLLGPTLKAPEDIDRIVRLWYGYDREALTPEQVSGMGETTSVEARLAIARYLIATARPELAIALLKPLATGWSNDIQGLYARARVRSGDMAGFSAADQVLAKDPDNGDALLVRAGRATDQGRANAAIIDLQRVVSNYPAWDEGYLGLADAYTALRKPVGVRRAFELGLRSRPQSYPLAVAYIDRLGLLGDRDRAISVARQFALDSPALARGWRLYVDTCGRMGGQGCRAEATEGLARSGKRLGLDLPPGTPPPITLIGRIT